MLVKYTEVSPEVAAVEQEDPPTTPEAEIGKAWLHWIKKAGPPLP